MSAAGQYNMAVVSSLNWSSFACWSSWRGSQVTSWPPVCGRWSTRWWVLPIVKQIPSGFTPRPPLTAQRPDRINLPLRKSNPWANFDKSRTKIHKLVSGNRITNSWEDLQIYLHFANIFCTASRVLLAVWTISLIRDKRTRCTDTYQLCDHNSRWSRE